jgi:hypothetical protein
MEPLWSPVAATGGNGWQMPPAQKPRKQAKTVAVACVQSPIEAHGKEGVDGSSPSEGSTKAPHVGAFLFSSTCSKANVRWVWSLLWSFQVRGPRSSGGRKRAPEHERRRAHRTRSKCRWAIVCATDMPRATQPVPQRIPMTFSGSVSGQRSNDRGERVGRAGAEDEVGEADLLPSPLDFLACRRRVSGEDGQ